MKCCFGVQTNASVEHHHHSDVYDLSIKMRNPSLRIACICHFALPSFEITMIQGVEEIAVLAKLEVEMQFGHSLI
jgi:hypothetical protein